MKKHSGTILLSINNEQKEYARCMQIMEAIFNKKSDIANFAADNIYLFPDSNLDLYSILKTAESAKTESAKLSSFLRNPLKIQLEDYDFLFEIYCNDNENDIVNLQFFFLVRKWLNKVCNIPYSRIGLHIKTSQPKDQRTVYSLYYKAIEFLTYQCTEDSPYFIDNWDINKNSINIVSFKTKEDVILKRFSPLIEITSSGDMGIDFWQQSMESFFTRCQSKNIYWEEIECQEVLHADKDKAQKKNDVEAVNDITDKIKRQRFACAEWDYRLMRTLKECFCTDTVKVARKRMSFCNSIDFKKHIQEMSLLSFYIFCLFEYNSSVNNKTPIDYEHNTVLLAQIILKMRDIGDGFFQLMSNTIEHSDFGEGYFSFRIHDAADKNYLKNKYKEYINKQKENTDFFLEMQIVDFSTQSVPDKFMQNVRQRAKETDEPTDSQRYIDLLRRMQKINMSSFFRPNEEEMRFWEDYYKISDNIVYHYGLQLFDSVIDSNEGCFLAISTPQWQINDDVAAEKSLYCSFKTKPQSAGDYYIPGTQYSALLPLYYVEKTEYTAVNADINYTELVSDTFEGKLLRNISEEKISEIFKKYNGNLHQKEKTIKEISEDLVNKTNDNFIYYCDMAKQHPSNRYLEFFCKILIRFITKRPENEKVHIALLNCDDKHMIEITRIFSVFYNKQGISPIFKNVQLYLSGKNPENAFLFAGSNISTVLNRAERLAIACGIQPECITILTSMLQRKAANCSLGEQDELSVAVAPFELIKYGEKEILFKKILNNILNNDICRMNTGCRIPNAHVRLGSKIHITEFYQAEILFQNNYFTTRFAYLVAEDIIKKTGVNDNLVLVGYETYSEMLCYEIVELLKNKLANVKYIIYEQKNGETFRYIEELKVNELYSYMFIVPINSTLTTHNKIQAALGRIRIDANQVKGNYAILLFCPKNDDKEFELIRESYGWTNIGDTEIETSLVAGKKVRYFFRTDVEWKNALECKCCFPDMGYDKEQPLIETNKASIIPMQKLELLENDNAHKMGKTRGEKEELKKIKALSQCMIYSHVERNGNHFNYYFQMEHFFRKNKDSIKEWLKKIQIENDTKNDTIVFNIIVSPQHHSNNGFVVEVNRNVFHNASLVLNIEIHKEFRSNIKAKYSNLLLLYNNLEKCSRKAEISFHFVDDTIISGATFYRAKSIIRSIFPKQTGKFVQLNIFKSVILLLNRTSSFSRMNYQESNFYSYVNLEISSLRTQEDACVLCNTVKDAEKMEELSSTQAMSRYWSDRKRYHRCKNIKEMDIVKTDKEKHERAERRLICSHRANQILNDQVQNWGEVSEIKRCIIKELLCVEKGMLKTEWQLSYIKILSRPFFNFSSGIRKAIFEIMLELIDYMLGNEKTKETKPELEILLKDIDDLKAKEDCRMLYVLLLTLIKRLADLGSTFIIRKDNIRRILDFYETIKEGDYKRDFKLKYRACIKKLISLSGDEIKATWTEYLLIYEAEYTDSHNKSKGVSEDIRDFYNMLYMENIRVFRDAVWDLTKEKRKEIEKELKENDSNRNIMMQSRLTEDSILIFNCYDTVESSYYLQNFKMIYDWNFENEESIIDSLCYLYLYLLYGGYIYIDIQKYYNKLTEILKNVTQAKYVQIIVCNDAKEMHLLGDSQIPLNENRVTDELKKIIERENEFIDNSYFISGDNGFGILKFGRESVGNVNPKSIVYFGFAFEADKKTHQQVIKRLRNVLAFRHEFVHKFEIDFETDAIQQFLISMNQNKLLTGSGAIDHAYEKTRMQFLNNSRNLAKEWKGHNAKPEDMKDQVGYLYLTVANTIISRLFQKAVVGKYDGTVNAGSIHTEWLNTTVLGEIQYFNLYERVGQRKRDENPLKHCYIKIDQTVNLDKYFTFSTGNFTLSAIIMLLVVNAGKHTRQGDIDIEVSVKEIPDTSDCELIFSNVCDWPDAEPQEKLKLIQKQVQEPNYDAQHGITLWTLNKYFQFHTANKEKERRGIKLCLTEKEGNRYFNVSIPIYTEEK